jgi:hypothetical protein
MSVEQKKVGLAKRKRRTWVFGALMLVVGLAVAGWGGRNAYGTARMGAAYVAKHTCSCMFVAGRTAEACSKDYDPEAARLLTVQPAAHSVTVSALAGVMSARAEFEDGFGCHLVD